MPESSRFGSRLATISPVDACLEEAVVVLWVLLASAWLLALPFSLFFATSPALSVLSPVLILCSSLRPMRRRYMVYGESSTVVARCRDALTVTLTVCACVDCDEVSTVVVFALAFALAFVLAFTVDEAIVEDEELTWEEEEDGFSHS